MKLPQPRFRVMPGIPEPVIIDGGAGTVLGSCSDMMWAHYFTSLANANPDQYPITPRIN